MSSVQICTAKEPMPENRDQLGQHWFHYGAQPVEGRFIAGVANKQLYRCPNCGQEFWAQTAPRNVDRGFWHQMERANKNGDGAWGYE